MKPRTKFKKEIISEFLPPARQSNKVIILARGMPGAPRHPDVLKFWSKKGFWVFFPRYRGSWESAGRFLKKSPHLDILDIIPELSKGFEDLWSGKRYKIKKPEIYVIGGSFGGPAAIFAARDPRITKAVAISPVIDWRINSPDESMEKLGKFVKEGFGGGYRFSMRDWKRLSRGEFYNPIDEVKTIPAGKLLIFHSTDDRSCPYPPAFRFAKKTGVKLITFTSGGHFGISESILPSFYKHIKKFFR